MKFLVNACAGAGALILSMAAPAPAQENDPLFGGQAVEPQQAPAAAVVETLTPAQMAALFTAAGAQSAVLKTEEGVTFVGVRGPGSAELFFVPLCEQSEGPCSLFRMISLLAQGPVGGEVYLRFHSSTFSAFLDRTQDGQATFVTDGMVLDGGVNTENVVNRLRLFGSDLQRAQQALTQEVAQGTQDPLQLAAETPGNKAINGGKRLTKAETRAAVAAYIDALELPLE